MKYLTLFIFLITLTIFCSSYNTPMKYEIPPNEKAVNKVMARNSKILAKKYNLQPFGTSVAMPGGDIQFLELEFQIHGPLSKEQIRKTLIDTARDFLSDINADSDLCYYLKNHSLNINEIGITLFLIDSTGRGLRDPNISIAAIWKSNLEYDTLIDKYDDELKCNIPSFTSKHHESYEEALNALDKN